MTDTDVLWLLAQHLIITTGLAGVVWLICRSMRPSPAASHLLWLIVLCRLVIPPVATWPWTIPLTPVPQSSSDVSATVTEDEPVSLVDVVPVPSAEFRTATERPIAANHQRPARQHSKSSDTMTVSSWQLTAAVWLVGTIGIVVLMFVRIVRTVQALRETAGASDWLQNDVDDWCGRLGVRPPVVVVNERIRSPFLWCFGSIRLVWPAGESTAEQRDRSLTVLIHELAHLKRRDHWTAWLELLALTVWWWNPVFWFVRRQLRTAAEMACDAWVVELLPERRRSYAEMLVEFSRHEPSRRLAFGAVGASVGSRRMFARRLEMIMSDTRAARFSRWTMLSAVLAGALSLPVFAFDRPESSEGGDTTEESSAAKRQVAETTRKNVETRYERNTTSDSDDAGEASKKQLASSLEEVLSQIEQQYYGEIDRYELEAAALQAIIAKLDERSSILSREEYEQLTVSVDGDLVGVGIAIHLDKETRLPVVTRPIRNSPALAAGLRKDDVIISIDGESTQEKDLRSIVDLIRGEKGSTVTLGVQRGDEKLEAKVVRDRFEMMLVNPWSVSEDQRDNYWADRDARIGYVHIPAFSRSTAPQMKRVLAELSEDGMKSLVIDLRDCGGGLLSAATEVVDMFLDEGVILSSTSRNADERTTFMATAGGDYTELPLVVLMNEYTASAAEIVAACLQDHHRAAMVGQQTYGRGTVQSVFPLQHGGALKLTTAAWIRPNGQTLLRREGSTDWGVRPDAGLAVKISEEAQKELARQRTSRLDGEDVEEPADDAQLRKAVAFLKLD